MSKQKVIECPTYNYYNGVSVLFFILVSIMGVF